MQAMQLVNIRTIEKILSQGEGYAEKVVLIDDKIVHYVDSTKFLGVFIDSNLTWRRHIDYIKGKIAHGIGIICKA